MLLTEIGKRGSVTLKFTAKEAKKLATIIDGSAVIWPHYQDEITGAQADKIEAFAWELDDLLTNAGVPTMLVDGE